MTTLNDYPTQAGVSYADFGPNLFCQSAMAISTITQKA